MDSLSRIPPPQRLSVWTCLLTRDHRRAAMTTRGNPLFALPTAVPARRDHMGLVRPSQPLQFGNGRVLEQPRRVYRPPAAKWFRLITGFGANWEYPARGLRSTQT